MRHHTHPTTHTYTPTQAHTHTHAHTHCRECFLQTLWKSKKVYLLRPPWGECACTARIRVHVPSSLGWYHTITHLTLYTRPSPSHPSHSTHPHRKNHHSNMPRGNEVAMEASVALKAWQPKLVEYYISGQTDKFRRLLRSMEEVIAQRGNISHSTATLVSTPPSHHHTSTTLTLSHLHHSHTLPCCRTYSCL